MYVEETANKWVEVVIGGDVRWQVDGGSSGGAMTTWVAGPKVRDFDGDHDNGRGKKKKNQH